MSKGLMRTLGIISLILTLETKASPKLVPLISAVASAAAGVSGKYHGQQNLHDATGTVTMNILVRGNSINSVFDYDYTHPETPGKERKLVRRKLEDFELASNDHVKFILEYENYFGADLTPDQVVVLSGKEKSKTSRGTDFVFVKNPKPDQIALVILLAGLRDTYAFRLTKVEAPE